MSKVSKSCRRLVENQELAQPNGGPSHTHYSGAGDPPPCPKANEILQSARETLQKARALEEAIRMNEQWAQDTIETAPCAIITMDGESLINGWNNEAEK